jgi:FixJ family two-component response regulator
LELQDELAVRRPAMPVVFISAYPEERIRKRARAAGAAAFFRHPVDDYPSRFNCRQTLRTP